MVNVMSTAAEVQIEPVVYAFQTERGGWRVAGSRVSMDSIIHAYWQGESPEQIVQNFPTLSLEQVHGAMAFYLRHKDLMDAYMKRQAEHWQQLQGQCEQQNSDLRRRISERAEKMGPAGAS